MAFGLKFFPVKDLFFSIVPTVGTYSTYLQGPTQDIFPNKYVALIIGLIGSLILAVIFYLDNVNAYKRSLAEILATGYFINFTGRLAKLLKSKAPIGFSFPDNSVKTFTSDDISVEIGMPETLSSLAKYSEQVEAASDIVYVRESSFSEPYWVRAVVRDNKLVIYEFPRTLFSLSKYLVSDFSDNVNAERNSRKIYAFFAKKMEQLFIEHSNEVPVGKLVVKQV